MALIVAASVLPRIPVLYSADYAFNSDEAVNALVLERMLAERELAFHNWDASYYGTVESLLALPFVLAGGMTAATYKLGAIAGFLPLVVGTALLGRRLYGPAWGLVAAGMLIAFSPHAVLWSTTASGGYLLTVSWGTLAFLLVARLRAQEAARPWQLGLLGLMLGFGLYVYELFLTYVASLVAWSLVGLMARRAGEATPRHPPRRVAAGALLLVTGLAIGWAPKLAVLATGGELGTKRPSYAFAAPATVADNAELLATGSLPALLGADVRAFHRWTPPLSVTTTCLGFVVLVLHVAAWGLAARRAAAAALPRRPALDIEALLAIHVAVTVLLFVLSPNPKEIYASRYLLPCLTSVPVLSAGLLGRISRRSRPAGALASALLLVFPLVQTVRAQQDEGYLGADLLPVRIEEPLHGVIAHLRERGIAAAYGTYWSAYKATFLAGGDVVVAPLFDWDRNPELTRRVRNAPREAYVLEPVFPGAKELRALLVTEGAPMYGVLVQHYLVLSARDGGRLLSPFALQPAAPLAAHAARLELIGEPPAAVPAGATFEVPVRVTNTGADPWSRDGVGSGTYRVAAAYRWVDAAGAAVVAEGDRTLLPRDVRAGETVAMPVRVTAPPQPGTLQLRLTLVQEGVAWFDQAAGVAAERRVRVLPAGGR